MRINKKDIEGRVNHLNELLGLKDGNEYGVNYASHYGGWEMYVINTHGDGRFGFSYRKSTAEFYAYLNGLIQMLYACRQGIVK